MKTKLKIEVLWRSILNKRKSQIETILESLNMCPQESSTQLVRI